MHLPIRYKIILPFAVLLVFVGVVGTGVATARQTSAASADFDARLLHDSLVANQLLAQLESDRVAQLRAASNTVGVPEAVASQDKAALSRLLTPIAANAQPANLIIQVLDQNARTTATILGGSGAATSSLVLANPSNFSKVPAVSSALAGRSDAFGERYVFVSTDGPAPMLYWVGPVRTDATHIVGAILVGQNLADVVRGIGGSAFYALNRQLIASALPSPTSLDAATASKITAKNATEVTDVQGGHHFGSLFSEWTMRGTLLGYFAIQLNADQLVSEVAQVRLILTLVFTGAAVLTLVVGSIAASLITRPVDLLVRSMRMVAAGDLHHRAPVKSRDEIGYLAQTFNEMASSLEEKTAALQESYFASIEALARAIDARDATTFGHSARVAAISVQIAGADGPSRYRTGGAAPWCPAPRHWQDRDRRPRASQARSVECRGIGRHAGAPADWPRDAQGAPVPGAQPPGRPSSPRAVGWGWLPLRPRRGTDPPGGADPHRG